VTHFSVSYVRRPPGFHGDPEDLPGPDELDDLPAPQPGDYFGWSFDRVELAREEYARDAADGAFDEDQRA
jgi:hypothetical protein